jgi:hypothetical protein
MITLNVQLNFPREVLDRSAIVLVAVNVVENDSAREPSENREDLQLDICFRVQVSTGVGVLKIATGSKPFDETLAVRVVGEGGNRKGKMEVLMEMIKAQECGEHTVCFGAE